ncbi:hypothetical protein PIROE2DRAFT_6178 [Piromyces sp. E2]|nr:hypothetical protein PIROE2DRAFT_6178 [Piromyces sp. E2]|eukprot:OUM66557.1 hypothetical protein PIROE2DRAFT_6178 [Piromyces sp. E2]
MKVAFIICLILSTIQAIMANPVVEKRGYNGCMDELQNVYIWYRNGSEAKLTENSHKSFFCRHDYCADAVDNWWVDTEPCCREIKNNFLAQYPNARKFELLEHGTDINIDFNTDVNKNDKISRTLLYRVSENGNEIIFELENKNIFFYLVEHGAKEINEENTIKFLYKKNYLIINTNKQN